MNEQYLEWLFLRNHMEQFSKIDYNDFMTYSFHGKLYDIQKMEKRYIELTKQLLKDYEL